MNLEFVQTPFASTSDLKDMTPTLVKNKKYWQVKEEKVDETGEPVIDLDEKKQSQSEQAEASETQAFQLQYKREHAIGYAYRKMPYHYSVYARLMNEIKLRVPHLGKGNTSILDYGAGLGSGLWAA
jgi:ribosomal protein RSM22 (predicted rRNA methylase)